MSTSSIDLLPAASPAHPLSGRPAAFAAAFYQFALWLLLGLCACSIVALHVAIPLRLTIGVCLVTALLGMSSCRIAEAGVLTRAVALFFILPFSACLGYLFDSQFVWWRTPLAMPLCRDEPLISRMIWIGICGFMGLVCGTRFYNLRATRPPLSQVVNRVLPAHLFIGLLLAAVGLSQLSAPPETILVANYASGQTESTAGELNFNAAFLISYLILIYLYVDAEHEPAGSSMRRSKQRWILAACTYIVVVLQILRGDRECFGLLMGIASLYVTGGSFGGNWWQAKRDAFMRMLRLSLPVFCIVVLFLLLGFLRSMLSESAVTSQSLREMATRVLTLNTWTGVLLTNLGMAEEEANFGIQHLGGKTYVDYALSMPPGVISGALGYKRPLDGRNSPNWWYIPLAGGGTHPVVVPYKNFGVFGVFGVLTCIGVFVARCERYASGYGFGNRLLFGSMATITPLWMWYGDMNFLRTLVACGCLWAVHHFFAVVRPADSLQRHLKI